jgi:hypothetical protein
VSHGRFSWQTGRESGKKAVNQKAFVTYSGPPKVGREQRTEHDSPLLVKEGVGDGQEIAVVEGKE